MTTNNRQRTFIDGADDSFFPLENLPMGIFSHNDTARICTRVGNQVLDLAALEKANLLKIEGQQAVFSKSSLNDFASFGARQWKKVRETLQHLLSIDNQDARSRDTIDKALYPYESVKMQLPFKTESFSDFYASEHHASNVGKLFRNKENPLLPNWKYLPVGYHGRASTIFLSGNPIRRPKGQIKKPDEAQPRFLPSQKLDFELELGAFVGVGNPCGTPIALKDARSHLFGVTLLNDWSARDIQAFEYQPLGPFLAKSFATSIAPWVITTDALKPFMHPQEKQMPEVAPYLQDPSSMHLDIHLRVELLPKGSNERTLITSTNSKELYWTLEQMLAHHTVNNCIMLTGDLLGSGTISGKDRSSWGSLLELTFNGTDPIELKNGEKRKFLEDGDTVIFSGYCHNNGYKIGFGELIGTIAEPS